MWTDRVKKREHVFLIIILVIAFVLRLYGILVYAQLMPSITSQTLHIRHFREATFGMAAWRITEGDLPYRDFFHAQTPLSPLLLALVFSLFGVGIIQARLFLVFFTTFTCFMIFLAGKRIDYKTGLLGSLTFAIAPTSVLYGMLALNDFIAMTFSVIGYYFLTPIIMNDKGTKRDFTVERNNLLLAGFFLSIGVMIKIIVAPIFFAFIAILIIEGQFADVRISDQVKNVTFLIVGFVIPLLLTFSAFYLIIGDEFTTQVLGQHLSKSSTWKNRWKSLVQFLILENFYIFVFFVLSAPFAARKSYGRGLIICTLFMVVAVFLFVPRQYYNYYEINIPLMAMVCGFIPLPDLKSLDTKLAILIFSVIVNVLLFPIYRFLTQGMVLRHYFTQGMGQAALLLFLFTLIALILIVIIEGQFAEVGIYYQVKKAVSFPYQMLKLSVLKNLLNLTRLRSTTLKCLNSILNRNVAKALAASLIVLIALTNVSYPPPSETDRKTIDWIKANTSPDDYILADNLNINFRAVRRSPFAEISYDRTKQGKLTGEMFIEACYEYDIQVVVNTGRLFGNYDTFNVFLEFLKENYVQIEVGHTIYVRTTSLQ